MIKFYSWSWRFTETSEFIVCNCHNLTGLKETLKKENMQKICAKASCEWSSFFFSSNEFFVELRLSIYLIFFPEKDIDNNYSFLNTIQRKKKKRHSHQWRNSFFVSLHIQFWGIQNTLIPLMYVKCSDFLCCHLIAMILTGPP